MIENGPPLKKPLMAILVAFAIVAQVAIVLPVKAQNPASIGVNLTNAYDAFGKDVAGLKQDFGFSCVVNYKGKMILFDANVRTWNV
jgi:predicted TIM-barrel enzyme